MALEIVIIMFAGLQASVCNTLVKRLHQFSGALDVGKKGGEQYKPQIIFANKPGHPNYKAIRRMKQILRRKS